MKLLANENIPNIAIEALRAKGHDINWVHSTLPGSNDLDVLALANAEG